MPSLNDLARVFAALSPSQILIGLAAAATIIVLVADWRLSLLSLAGQYILVAALLSTVIPLQIAVVRMIAGALVAMIFFLTARRARTQLRTQAQPDVDPSGGKGDGVFWVSMPFRIVSLSLIAVSVVAISRQFTLLNAPLPFWVGGVWLCGAGLLVIALARDALKLGMGLLLFTSGFGVVYVSIDASLLIYALLVLSDLVIALAVSHIAIAPTYGQGSRRGEA